MIIMRGSTRAEAHRSEMAVIIRPSVTEPLGRDLNQAQMEAALAMMAFVLMAAAARSVLSGKFQQYMTYGLPVDVPMDAATVVNRIFVTVTEELQAHKRAPVDGISSCSRRSEAFLQIGISDRWDVAWTSRP